MVARLPRICGGAPLEFGNGNVLKILERVHAVLRRLRGDAVADAGPRVQPERGRRLEAPAEGNQHVAGNIAGRKAYLRCPRAVNVHLEARQIEGFLNAQVNRAGDVFEFAHQPVGKSPVGVKVVPHHLDIDGRREAEIQDLADHVRGQKIKRYPGEFPS